MGVGREGPRCWLIALDRTPQSHAPSVGIKSDSRVSLTVKGAQALSELSEGSAAWHLCLGVAGFPARTSAAGTPWTLRDLQVID